MKYDYDEHEDHKGYMTTTYDFPVSNHIKCVDKRNLGFVRGIMEYDIPVEAEIWKAKDELNIAFILPSVFDVSDGENETEKSFNPYDTTEREALYQELKEEKITPLSYEREGQDLGVLPIGMIDEGYEGDPFVTQNYVELLENSELIDFGSELYNGTVQYLIDVEGNSFARIIICLSDKDNVWATTPIHFKEFLANTKKSKFRVL